MNSVNLPQISIEYQLCGPDNMLNAILNILNNNEYLLKTFDDLKQHFPLF